MELLSSVKKLKLWPTEDIKCVLGDATKKTVKTYISKMFSVEKYCELV